MLIDDFKILNDIFKEEIIIPKTKEEFVNSFIERIGDAECKRALKQYGKNFNVHDFHDTMGRFIRNEYKLWYDDSADLKKDVWNKMSDEIKEYYKKYWLNFGEIYEGRTSHADDISHELLIAVWQEIARRYENEI